MKYKRWISVAMLSILVTSMTMVQTVSCRRPSPFDWDIDPEQLERLRALLPYVLIVKTVVSTLNSILLLGLFVIHLRIHSKTGTKFSLGLVIFSAALLLYTILSNPITYRVIGFRRIGFGPLLMVPDIFTCIASAVLLYISRQ